LSFRLSVNRQNQSIDITHNPTTHEPRLWSIVGPASPTQLVRRCVVGASVVQLARRTPAGDARSSTQLSLRAAATAPSSRPPRLLVPSTIHVERRATATGQLAY
jgi:hypothetical protein